MKRLGGLARATVADASPSHPTTGPVTHSRSLPIDQVHALSLRALATAATGGDSDATDVLLVRVRQLALRYARARLMRHGAEDLAQDVAQEVCMAVIAALPTFEHRGSPFEAFVYSVASHKLADAQRTLLRGPTPVAEFPDRVDHSGGPEDRAVARDELRRVMSLLDQLPTSSREILILRVAMGMSAEETAAALGMSAGAVRVAQHRALAKVRAMSADAAAPTPSERARP
jgi:RNA polymerase sigma-70 factor (ECF subfamily)